jgi:hypothetical protein
VSSVVALLADHAPAKVRFGRCGLCWFPADDGHDAAVAAERKRLDIPAGQLKAMEAMVASTATLHQAGGHDQKSHGNRRGGELSQATRRTGGFTYQPVLNVTPRKGYSVSVFPERNVQVSSKSYTRKTVNDYVKANIGFVAEDPQRHVGGWLDKDTGLVHLDVVLVKDTEAEARQLAIEFGEIAYYNLTDGNEVRVDGS